LVVSEVVITLSRDQIDFFHREGYLALPAITTQEEVAQIREIYDRLFAQRAGRDEGNQFDLAGTDDEGREASLPQILMPVKYAPELEHTQLRRNALAIAKQLLGEDAVHQGEHAIMKPPRHGAVTPWHQDEAYWDGGLNYNALSIWVPLQPATLDNGCMHFIPGSHRAEVRPHHTINNDPRIHGLEVDELDDSTAVACPIPTGGATIHPSRTFHYAGPNTTDAPRRAYILGFGTPPVKRTEPREFYWNTAKRTPREARAAGKAKQP
jgi:ectoine hydroxylase-related dioxygenase (phytanoyl-CoA dioxygenase family)